MEQSVVRIHLQPLARARQRCHNPPADHPATRELTPSIHKEQRRQSSCLLAASAPHESRVLLGGGTVVQRRIDYD